ncbi:hypothetical protein [Sulfuricurvum sp. RIFCSPLOWO2_12_FULL_43_24]|uniref:hypothetical protein n=1 Tax=Sulfuricurvum sp. RIFCSPLOWO2_12_FULL_43_24 TaxID=1802247 RepID=UPI0008CC5A90|nr:hypothetical protein [Sulfuricurvum sp. RIFCSPLOWO2_12_FULL_43_24]OHD88986.1 MAG: hypothetical protein A3G19_10380 [Sulfuricurvum sp. RIFCSPLOWO2_12_FULL_43_24]
MNKFKRELRQWHIWLGVAFALPLLIVGLTTIFLAHGKALKLDEYAISSSYFPGYWSEKKKMQGELRVYFVAPNGAEYYGYKNGLIIQKEGKTQEVEEFAQDDIRSITLWNDQVVIGTKKGVFIENEGAYESILEADIWDVMAQNDLLYAVSKEGMMSYESEAQEWEEVNLPERKACNDGDAVTLKKLNIDLHTGKALLGDKGMWIWEDILAISLLFFIFSGVFLWYSKKQRPSTKA